MHSGRINALVLGLGLSTAVYGSSGIDKAEKGRRLGTYLMGRHHRQNMRLTKQLETAPGEHLELKSQHLIWSEKLGHLAFTHQPNEFEGIWLRFRNCGHFQRSI